jgi:hypothetical protein
MPQDLEHQEAITPTYYMALFNLVDSECTGVPTESEAPFQLITSYRYGAYILLFSMTGLDAAHSSDNQTRVLEIYNFDDSQESALFDVKAEFGGFYNLLASRGSLVAFGADVDHHKAHVVHAFGGAARLEVGPGITRVSSGAYTRTASRSQRPISIRPRSASFSHRDTS